MEVVVKPSFEQLKSTIDCFRPLKAFVFPFRSDVRGAAMELTTQIKMQVEVCKPQESLQLFGSLGVGLDRK